MTDLVQKRGTTKNRRILFREADNITPVDITGGVVKVAVKWNPDDTNDESVFIHRSYFPDEILFTDPVLGDVFWQTSVEDTSGSEACVLFWGAELTLRGDLRTSAGTFQAVTGSRTLTYVGPDIAKFEEGDLIVANGAGDPANQLTITIISVDEDALTVLTDYDGWKNETFAHDTYQADRPDVSVNLSGSFTITADTVT